MANDWPWKHVTEKGGRRCARPLTTGPLAAPGAWEPGRRSENASGGGLPLGENSLEGREAKCSWNVNSAERGVPAKPVPGLDQPAGSAARWACLERCVQAAYVSDSRNASTSVGDGLFMAECCRTNTRRSRLVRVPGGLRCRGVGGNGGGGLFEDILTAANKTFVHLPVLSSGSLVNPQVISLPARHTDVGRTTMSR
eukprot:CAMPEP_0173068568 /NCGR_PEP_ID=MMETSP1102-20130122/7491_1 /TAXON_ID=49646 /ORGANISM="Geminigera sp., Strain Caron Lab Isolate" /LENGTH=196 /DNA_ID=CAMNT_0013936455 /DNA_START=779 /DNA_END=1364 /DNA_ORIENTATION=+